MRFVLLSLFSVLFISCSESDVEQTVSMQLQKDTLFMDIGHESYVDFSVSPASVRFNYNVNDPQCSISLLRRDKSKPTDYSLVRIDTLPNQKESPNVKNYRAYIRDGGSMNYYKDTLCLQLRIQSDKTGGGNSYESFNSSEIICTYSFPVLSELLLRTGLPLAIISTINAQEPTCDYVEHPKDCLGRAIQNATKVPGRLKIAKLNQLLYDSGDYDSGKSGITMKIRGNTSAYTPKKPYKLKLQSKTDLLFRGNNEKYDDKDWLLLKYDGLNSLIGLKVNELMNLQWTPSFSFINVIINGDYRGLYMITESVKRNEKCRLNVSKDGFIIEYDPYWWNENIWFKSYFTDHYYNGAMNYTFKYPDSDDIVDEQIEYISSYMDEIESRIIKNSSYEELIDVRSWASWLLAHDILGSADGAGSNIYMTKYDRTDKSLVQMANLWDFDGIYYGENYSTIHVWNGTFFHMFFNSWANKSFLNEYKDIWNKITPSLFDNIDIFLDSQNPALSKTVDLSLIYDSQRWRVNNASVGERIQYAKKWFSQRKSFLEDRLPMLN